MKILQSITSALVSKHDFVSSAVYRSFPEEDAILYVEHWKTREALHRHIQSPLYRRILSVMELSEQKPEITFSESLEGLELVYELRK